MQFVLLFAGLLLVLREGLIRVTGVVLIGVSALWIIAGVRSLSPENLARVTEIRKESMSAGMKRLVDRNYLRKKGDSFQFSCPHCASLLQLAYDPEHMGLIKCGGCSRFAFWMQIDEEGIWRTMPEYYEKTKPPVRGTAGFIWAHFVDRFTYDHKKVTGSDPTWQSTPYTTRTMKGVCRDSATALADWFHSAGLDAFVGAGKTASGFSGTAGHAWCVLREDGVDYILETTGPSRFSLLKTPPRAEIMTDYFPYAMFDAKSCTGTVDFPERITNYRDPAKWYSIPSTRQ